MNKNIYYYLDNVTDLNSKYLTKNQKSIFDREFNLISISKLDKKIDSNIVKFIFDLMLSLTGFGKMVFYRYNAEDNDKLFELFNKDKPTKIDLTKNQDINFKLIQPLLNKSSNFIIAFEVNLELPNTWSEVFLNFWYCYGGAWIITTSTSKNFTNKIMEQNKPDEICLDLYNKYEFSAISIDDNMFDIFTKKSINEIEKSILLISRKWNVNIYKEQETT